MSVLAHETRIEPLIRRPVWLLSVLMDGSLGAVVYPASYWLRFQDDRLATFLPTAWATLPFVVAGQLLALVLIGAYARRARIDWLVRIVTGIALGTAISGFVVAGTVGLEGVSRTAFVADAILLAVAAIGWRGVWILKVRAQLRAAARGVPSADLIDRASEMTTLRAMGASLYNYRALLKNLVLKDLKLKYRGSVFGFLWSLLNPLLMIAVYTVAFTFILRIRSQGFVFYLMLGQLAWAFFASSAGMSTGAIIDNAGLLKSVLFPRAILPIGTVLFNLAQYLLTVSVFLPLMMIWYGVPLSAAMLLFPVFLALQVVFTIGVALLLATWTAFFRDVRHLVEVALTALFWATPIVYELRQVPEQLRLLILLSPVSPFVVAYQQIFFYREWPAGTVWLMACVQAVGAFVAGALVFVAANDRFTEQL